jgi:osmoprotectant transport system substrate-binding protein
MGNQHTKSILKGGKGMKKKGWVWAVVILWAVLFGGSFQGTWAQEKIVVGSKGFTEQLVLGNMVAFLMENSGFKVDRKIGLGGTVICHEAIVRGDINVYVEYTG